jgi:aspartate-semialdehyde dehydrogenase
MQSPHRGFHVAVVGATGMIGQEMLRVLKQRKFPVAKLKALASERSVGSSVAWNGSAVPVEAVDERSFDGIDLVLIATGSDVSRTYAPIAVRQGALVVDNSSAWRMADHVPLVVPEVNEDDIATAPGIVANPNCCTIPLTVVLEPLRRAAGLERVVVATYQSASGGGRALVDELDGQVRAVAGGRAPEVREYPHQLAMNVVPGGWATDEDGWNEEERKIVDETRKILHDPELRIVASCVRVPVVIGHGEMVFVETERELGPDEARSILREARGVVVEDDPGGQRYPTPLAAAGTDVVFVGRIRRDPSSSRGLVLWVVSDNLRKGGALNAVQIAERAMEMGILQDRLERGVANSV